MTDQARLFCARMQMLPQILGCIRDACQRAYLLPPVSQRVELVIEELFTNTVQHGYGGESDNPVWVRARCSPGALYLTYEDAARAFDPLDVELPATPPQKPGGIGIPLVRKLPNSVAYRREGERNVLILCFQAPAAAAPALGS
jgi:anti-sigma regulatory factor (Ser/Thr protein kinase)